MDETLLKVLLQICAKGLEFRVRQGIYPAEWDLSSRLVIDWAVVTPMQGQDVHLPLVKNIGKVIAGGVMGASEVPGSGMNRRVYHIGSWILGCRIASNTGR